MLRRALRAIGVLALLPVGGCFLAESGHFRGTSDFTIASAPGGQGTTGAQPLEGMACFFHPGTPKIVLVLGPDCALRGAWTDSRTGSYGTLATGQTCLLPLAGTPTSFKTTHGALRATGRGAPDDVRTIEGTVAGTATDGSGRYIVLRFSLGDERPASDEECRRWEPPL
jgi:hypothetical protein